MLLPGVGAEGQRRLGEASALVVGCGALGCAISDHLVRAGVGTVAIVDRDVVEVTNLQRQTLFDERDAEARTPKAEAARARLARINSGVRVRAVVADLTYRNAERVFDEARPRVVLDGTDNFETRYLINDLAVSRGAVYAYGGVVSTRGMAMTIRPGITPCLRCVFDEPPAPGTAQTCDTAGVLGPAVAIVAACQAADAIKVLLGREDLLGGTLLEFDLWTNVRRRIDLSSARREECVCCGLRRFEYLSGERGGGTASLCGQDAVQVTPDGEEARGIDLEVLAARLGAHGRFERTPFMVRGVLEGERGEAGPCELTVFADGRAVVRGTRKPEFARAIYARYVGA